MSATAYLGLGSNIGDRKSHLDTAVASLAGMQTSRLLAVSSYHETAPAGGPSGQGAFLNAAAAVETDLEPGELLEFARSMEAHEGRVRAVRWGERTLDVDLLLHGDRVIDSTELTVPHPRMAVRRFVLVPLAEIAPNVIEPLTGRTISRLLDNLDRRPSFLCLVGPDWPKLELFRRVSERLNAIGLFDGDASADSYELQTSLSKEPDFPTILAQKAREYDVGRWSTGIWGDRWVMSDFCFDFVCVDITSLLDDASTRASIQKSFLAARNNVIHPTFLVATHPSVYVHLRRRYLRPPRGHPLLEGIPTICPGYGDPFGFVRDHPGSPETWESIDLSRIEAQVGEILAACAASRP